MKRFITSGINTTLSPQLQLYLWQLHDTLKEEQKEVDYLQVYRLYEIIENGLVAVKHTAEVPPHEEIYLFRTKNTFEGTVYIIKDCIDNEQIETMLLASEY